MTLDQSMLFILERWARNSFWEGAAAKTMITPPFSLMVRLMAWETSPAAALPISSRLGRIFNSKVRFLNEGSFFISSPSKVSFSFYSAIRIPQSAIYN
jgi:hypothetical protein